MSENQLIVPTGSINRTSPGTPVPPNGLYASAFNAGPITPNSFAMHGGMKSDVVGLLQAEEFRSPNGCDSPPGLRPISSTLSSAASRTVSGSGGIWYLRQQVYPENVRERQAWLIQLSINVPLRSHLLDSTVHRQAHLHSWLFPFLLIAVLFRINFFAIPTHDCSMYICPNAAVMCLDSLVISMGRGSFERNWKLPLQTRTVYGLMRFGQANGEHYSGNMLFRGFSNLERKINTSYWQNASNAMWLNSPHKWTDV